MVGRAGGGAVGFTVSPSGSRQRPEQEGRKVQGKNALLSRHDYHVQGVADASVLNLPPMGHSFPHSDHTELAPHPVYPGVDKTTARLLATDAPYLLCL